MDTINGHRSPVKASAATIPSNGIRIAWTTSGLIFWMICRTRAAQRTIPRGPSQVSLKLRATDVADLTQIPMVRLDRVLDVQCIEVGQ